MAVRSRTGLRGTPKAKVSFPLINGLSHESDFLKQERSIYNIFCPPVSAEQSCLARRLKMPDSLPDFPYGFA